ncbi:MAG: copper transporter [Halanaerobacter sp.]
MLVNIKYHLVTIMALFITLAIGILVGSTIIGSDSIVEQQQKLINNLKSDFKILRKENQNFKVQVNRLERKLARNSKYRKEILSFLFNDRLTDEKLLIVNGNNIQEPLANKVINYLKLANPKVIKLLKQSELEKGEYTKVVILGKVDEEIEKDYFDTTGEIIKLSRTELGSFSKTIEKILNIVDKNSSD